MPRRVPAARFDQLIRAATEMFLEHGYRRAQMSDVAERLGVAKGTLYLYVESKEALLDAVLRHADADRPLGLPRDLPLPTPAPGTTLEFVRKRVAEEGALPELVRALERRRVTDARAELAAILHELYDRLARHRVGIKLVDRCSQDYPELAEVWFASGRQGLLELLARYLRDRIRRRRLRRVDDVALTARMALEVVVYWAVHRHWDPAPFEVDDRAAEDAAVDFIAGALAME